MKPILKMKIAVDAVMSVFMLLLMTDGLVGEAAHEWIGMGMFALFVAHHILNCRWIKAVPKGRYTPLRMVQTVLTGLIFLCMHDRLHDQRHRVVPSCICVSSEARWL